MDPRIEEKSYCLSDSSVILSSSHCLLCLPRAPYVHTHLIVQGEWQKLLLLCPRPDILCCPRIRMLDSFDSFANIVLPLSIGFIFQVEATITLFHCVVDWCTNNSCKCSCCCWGNIFKMHNTTRRRRRRSDVVLKVKRLIWNVQQHVARASTVDMRYKERVLLPPSLLLLPPPPPLRDWFIR